MNLILIIIDSLRADHVGINGNAWIHTPHLDRLGGESVRFTKAYPESLPTLPVRKAIHTGKQVFPFKDWIPWKQWPVPGWNPVSETDSTLVELLQEKGYRTGFITDVYHLFKPGMNLHRGFDEWQWIRGQEFDCYASGATEEIDVDKYLSDKMDKTANSVKLFSKYLRNTTFRKQEEDYFLSQVFRSAARWLEENRGSDKFFLCIDSFDPHV